MQAAVPVAAGYWDHFEILNGNNCVSHRERIPGHSNLRARIPTSSSTQRHSAFGAVGFRDICKYEAAHFIRKWSQILKLLPEQIPLLLTSADTEDSFMPVELQQNE